MALIVMFGYICFIWNHVQERFAWSEGSYFAFAVVVAAGLDECAVSDGGAGGAPDVGLDEEGAEGVGCDVVFEGVCGAVCLVEDLFGGVVAAGAVGEG